MEKGNFFSASPKNNTFRGPWEKLALKTGIIVPKAYITFLNSKLGPNISFTTEAWSSITRFNSPKNVSRIVKLQGAYFFYVDRQGGRLVKCLLYTIAKRELGSKKSKILST